MTTLQARAWAHVAQREAKPRDHYRLWAAVRTAIGITILVALLAAAIAVRVVVYVHL